VGGPLHAARLEAVGRRPKWVWEGWASFEIVPVCLGISAEMMDLRTKPAGSSEAADWMARGAAGVVFYGNKRSAVGRVFWVMPRI
jgi:hypothetical protein